MRDGLSDQARELERSPTNYSSSSKTELIQQFVDVLVNNFKEPVATKSNRNRKIANPGRDIPGHNLALYKSWIGDAYQSFQEASRQNVSLSYTSEWVLDNYYIIRQALIQIKQDLPPSYLDQLPRLAGGPLQAFPRIYAIAQAVLTYQRFLLDPIEFQSILILFQQRLPLTMGELWALPSFLRYCLIEFLANALVIAIHPTPPPELPAVFQNLTLSDNSSGNLGRAAGETSNNENVANIIHSLRTISVQNWNDFFESVSSMEQSLRKDPSGIYPRMDFKTRDSYRKEIEVLSFATGRSEDELAVLVVEMARGQAFGESISERDTPVSVVRPPQPVLSKNQEEFIRNEPNSQIQDHIGDYLLGKGRKELERKIGYIPDRKNAFKRWIFRYATMFYLSSTFLFSAIIFIAIVFAAGLPGIIIPTLVPSSLPSPIKGLLQITGVVLLAGTISIPVMTVVSSVINWLITLLVQPRILPKLEFTGEIPLAYKSLVVIPAMITNRDDIDSLTQQLEMHYLCNPEPGLLFALLTDFRDADSESLPEDNELVNYAQSTIEAINRKYQDKPRISDADGSAAERLSGDEYPEGGKHFYLLHRKRRWNPSEGKWIGWERKRGKLHELNLLLRGKEGLSFTTLTGEMLVENSNLRQVRFVITLDTDTILPRGSAVRLAGTLAHPLNHARFDSVTGKVISGYTVLQPRMEIHPRSAVYSWFTRFFAGDAGLDLYSLAVSDAYQDLFGEGSYVGKGIYDVDAFEQSVDRRIPENTVLSHDLLEGIMGRAGLVTDITMIEDYPQNYFVQTMRKKRWIRGDWQLLPWLLKPNREGFSVSFINRWKIFDNLRQSLLAPALVIMFIIGLMLLSEAAAVWTAIILLSCGIPLITGIARSALQIMGGEHPAIALRPILWNLGRWLLAIAFLPYEAYIAANAVLTTFYRLVFSRRDLLQWTTAAQSAQTFGLRSNRNPAWQKMSPAIILAFAIAVMLQFLSKPALNGFTAPLAFLLPVLVLWTFSPVIVTWINRPIIKTIIPLNMEQANLLRKVARRTWGFFERFVGPEDHWLPPDHYQESPFGTIAHHTSPTNIGLLFTSTLSAYDMGYLDQPDLATRLSTTLDSLDRLELFRGHFLNWYDTLTLQSINPRYISTVDSGNLAASFIVTTQACKSIPGDHIFRWDHWQGYIDTISNLPEILKGMRKPEFDQDVKEIIDLIERMIKEIYSFRNQPNRWYSLFISVSGPFWQNISNRLMGLLMEGRSAFDLTTLGKLQEVAAQVDRHHGSVRRTILDLVPWIPLLDNPPSRLLTLRFSEPWAELQKNLPKNLSLEKIHLHVRAALPIISKLIGLLADKDPQPTLENGQDTTSEKWLEDLQQALKNAEANAKSLLASFRQISKRTEKFVNNMDFKFLYHSQRRVFHIGFNLDSGQLDNNYYDLLASEARIASIIAIAKGDTPQSHWLQLGRPVTRVDGYYVLLSWSGTMFEYLMPPLFLQSFPGTLLVDSTKGAVLHQIAYGKSKNTPWGISESGFYRFDANQNYQYRAFGVPGLGFKRGLADDLVIAPYASLMAVAYDPHAVVRNLVRLNKFDMIGLYGAYESIDFTADRLLLDTTSAIVAEYMAHHQGMILMAMDNFFHEDIMVKRMHSDPRIQSIELLLQEKTPQFVPIQDPQAEDVKGVQRLTSSPVEINPWQVPIQTPIPQVNLLSNGDYNVLLSNMGGGYSSWRDIDLTRWQPDGVLDPWGSWIYVQNLSPDPQANRNLWSAGHQPIPGDPSNMQVSYFAHMAVYHRSENNITSTMEIIVAPEDPVEIRRIHLYNNNEIANHLRLTSYGEVILTPQTSDVRHPAFNKLFIQSEFIPGLNLQIFTRRPRSKGENPVLMGHMVVVQGAQISARHEADRALFIGRNRTMRNPEALTSERYLSGATGATLDPIFSLGVEIGLEPHESANLAFMTFAGESREEIIALARRYQSWSLVTRSFHQANISAQAWLGKQDIDTGAFKDTLQILSALLYSYKNVRAPADLIAANRLGQPGLWRFGISGDFPILQVELDQPEQMELVREVLQVYRFLRSRRFKMDVVILNRQQTDYGAELNGMLYRLASKIGGEECLNQRGGIYILYRDQMGSEERTLLQTAARVVLSGEDGSLSAQMPGYSIHVHHLPKFTQTLSAEKMPRTAIPPHSYPLERITGLQFSNEFGAFSPDGREYIIDVQPGKSTPAPWVNVIGYSEFGFMVSEGGSQCTWSLNSGENRLTPWSNDPVRDPTGEALYLRDEETGEVWTPTPLPAGGGQPYRVTHGAGYTTFEHNSHGLRQHLTLFSSPDDPVKIIRLKVENTLDHIRRFTATQYVEWVLGTTHAASMAYIIPEYDSSLECLMASNPFNAEFGSRVAFLIASKPVHGLTADRTEFLGRGGSPVFPSALHRLGLESRITPGEDPCAVLQLHLDLHPAEIEEIYFVLGQGDNRVHALELARKYHDQNNVQAALEGTHAFWDHLLDAVKIHTPEPATNLILNRWMLYQTLSCRIWGRTGFYQSSGAFGFRDQLQDSLALLAIDPEITRGQILDAAQHQFEEGDVLHWWHPPSGRGVRTHISDDLLWLPYVTAAYIEATGDKKILREKVPFKNASILKKTENERYGDFPTSLKPQSIMDHCIRAIEKGITTGPHDLPLMGSGDWNDGLNRVGENGKGESIWLAWFLCDVLKKFAVICEQSGNMQTALRFRAKGIEYAAAIERSGWDGEWYRRAYYDNGASLGSILNSECQIDAIAQSWAVLSGSGDSTRSRQAMQSVLDRLVNPKDRLSLLFTPPFDSSPNDPGYVKGYLPGTRENGGQYTHAAIWNAWAFTLMGEGKQAGALFDLLNPIFQSDTPEKAAVYRVEPYVICGDIYSQPPYVRRGGWTWYTGSAAWMYRLGLEAMLGFHKVGDSVRMDPVIPPEWDGFDIRYLFKQSVYVIEVKNPEHVARHVRQILLDGKIMVEPVFPLVDDLKEHQVIVIMGGSEQSRSFVDDTES